jgi:hypothetical protein
LFTDNILDNHAHILDIVFADFGCPPWQPVPVLIPVTPERDHPKTTSMLYFKLKSTYIGVLSTKMQQSICQ